jgi:hypothetical protein
MKLAIHCRKFALASVAAVVAFGAATFAASEDAQAAGGRRIAVSFGYGPTYSSYWGGFGPSGPIYHPPSVHYHRVYHPTRTHWTPGRGWHTHGHFDHVPHYTPGHFDHLHGNHIDLNPHFHD